MSNANYHIIGGGLAGLSAAFYLCNKGMGKRTYIYEASAHLGGRCYSFYDKNFDKNLDNGTHMIMSCNKNLLNMLKKCGGADGLEHIKPAVFPFLDIAENYGWLLQPSNGPLPLFLFNKNKTIPQTTAKDYIIDAINIIKEEKNCTLSETLKGSKLINNLWKPFCESALNISPEQASTKIFANIMKKAFALGGLSSRPIFVKHDLSTDIINPIENYLHNYGVNIIKNSPVRDIKIEQSEIKSFKAKDAKIDIAKNDKIISTLPAWSVNKSFPDINAPSEYKSIINAHFLVSLDTKLAGGNSFLGLINGTAHWIFVKNNVVSTTISNADELLKYSDEELATMIWKDVCKARGRVAAFMPEYKIVREKRATINVSPTQQEIRENISNPYKNMHLAGDWINIELPSCMEGAILSGFNAAKNALS